MPINWLEIGVQTAILVGLLAVIGWYARYRVAPRLRTQAGEWAGAAIGRFWVKLMEDAKKDAEEAGEGGVAVGGGGGAFKIGGFEITPALLKQGMDLLQFAQQMGWIKPGGSGGGKNPFLK